MSLRGNSSYGCGVSFVGVSARWFFKGFHHCWKQLSCMVVLRLWLICPWRFVFWLICSICQIHLDLAIFLMVPICNYWLFLYLKTSDSRYLSVFTLNNFMLILGSLCLFIDVFRLSWLRLFAGIHYLPRFLFLISRALFHCVCCRMFIRLKLGNGLPLVFLRTTSSFMS